MIINLAAYNAQKRGTLDRVAAKYRGLFMRVFEKHLRGLQPAMINALERKTPNLHLDGHSLMALDAALAKVLVEHFKYTVFVGVSDGYREVTPEMKLATWTQYAPQYPIENTFTNLAERKKRNDVFAKVMKEIRKKYGSGFAEIIDLEKERYLKNLKSVFATIAEDFFKNPDTDYTAQVAKDVIARVFDKTKVQAERIFRTETTSYFNDARHAYFSSETDVDFVQLFTVSDGRISEICECRSNYVIPLGIAGQKKWKPPFHPHCRTVQSPLVSYLKSDAEQIRRNLGSEFGAVTVEQTDGDNIIFIGKRKPPDVPLPKGWAS